MKMGGIELAEAELRKMKTVEELNEFVRLIRPQVRGWCAVDQWRFNTAKLERERALAKLEAKK
jgi:hypothetical protein